MKKTIVVAVILPFLLTASFAYAGLYRWVDDKGEVHFSDKVPVAASRKAVSEIDKHGAVTKTVDPEAIALAKLEMEESAAQRKKQDEVEKQKQKIEETLKKRDDYLLSTYENKQEIITFFETKIKLIKGNEAILKTHNSVLKKRLANLISKKAVTKHQSQTKVISEKVISIGKTIKQYKKALQQNIEERMKLSKNYQADVKRYVELTR